MYNNSMKIIKLNEVDSTHKYLKEYISKNAYNNPICILTDYQTNGIGSRGNNWTGVKGNMFFSFVLDKSLLPNDLPLQTCSIYFSFLLKEVLKDLGSNVNLKWPNDFYIDDKKIGGTITNVSGNLIYCGIGLNLKQVSYDFGKLDISIDAENVLNSYFSKLEKRVLWKKVFSDFQIEFEFSRKFNTNIDNQKISLSEAILNNDGSISINNKKVFSLR